jgi:hypothetical protein
MPDHVPSDVPGGAASAAPPGAAAGYAEIVARYRAKPGSRIHTEARPASKIRFADFRQVVRRHRPSDLLPELAALASAGNHFEPLYDITAQVTPPWTIALAARESIVWGNEHRDEPVTADSLRRLFNAHTSMYEPGPDVVGSDWALDTMTRLAFEQFGLQESPFKELARSHALLIEGAREVEMEVLSDDAWEHLLGAPFGQVVGATFFLQMAALSERGYFDVNVLERDDLSRIFDLWPRDVIHARVEQLSSTFEDFRAAYDAVPHPPSGYERFAYNPLTRRPFVRMPDGRLLAPQPRLILPTVSPGALFYTAIEEFGVPFARDMGHLTEHYVGRLLAPVATGSDDIELHPEIVYRDAKQEKKSIDWFLVLPGLVVLFEVKSARFGLLQRAAFGGYRQKVTSLLNDATKQISRTAVALDNHHESFGHIPADRPRVGIVVTCEPHYLSNSYWVRDMLDEAPLPTMAASLSEMEDLASLPADEIERQLLSIIDDPDRSSWGLGNALDISQVDYHPVLRRAFDAYPLPTNLDDVEPHDGRPGVDERARSAEDRG